MVRINIIDFTNDMSQVKVQDVNVESYFIPEGSEILTQLEYQLLGHKIDRKQKCALPDPALISLNGADYLVVTQLEEQKD